MKKLGSGVMDMTAGNPYKLIVLFSLPLLVGNVFQQLYNMVDSIVVGNVVGRKSSCRRQHRVPHYFCS